MNIHTYLFPQDFMYFLCNQIQEYTFLCGSDNKNWIKRFSKSVNVVARDPVIQRAGISINLSYFEMSRRENAGVHTRIPPASHQSRRWEQRTDLWGQEIRYFLLPLGLENERQWAVLTKGPTSLVIAQGLTILNVLENFRNWKGSVHKRGFETFFIFMN
jgi:hypothetical protein